MLQLALGTMRDLPRLQEITSVLIRHGLGDLVRRIVDEAEHALARAATTVVR